MYRKQYGRCPRVLASYLDIPCSYFVVRKDRSTDWLRNTTLTEPYEVRVCAPYEVQLMEQFEKQIPRSETLPCNPVRDYEAVLGARALDQKIASLEDDVSDDELDIAAHAALDEFYGIPEV
jgi:hypothetical protein